MSKRVNVLIGGARESLDKLADAVIDDREAGQRGAKVSVMLRMLAGAYSIAPEQTEALLRQVKELTIERRGW